MLKSAFSAMKCISGRITERSVFDSVVISNVRSIGSSRTVLNKDTDHVPGVFAFVNVV